MNMKEKGNNQFKKGNFTQATQYYKQYVQDDHSDNKNAYNNMALCYFKLQQYQKCVEACRIALQNDITNEKSYFRMMNAYRQMNNWYEVIVNAIKFKKNIKNVLDAREEENVRNSIKTATQQLTNTINKVDMSQTYAKQLIQIAFLEQMPEKNGSFQEQKNKILPTNEEQWNTIVQGIQQSQGYKRLSAINEAYKYILEKKNHIQKQQYREKLLKIKENIKNQDDSKDEKQKYQQQKIPEESEEQKTTQIENKNETIKIQMTQLKIQMNTNKINDMQEQQKLKQQTILKEQNVNYDEKKQKDKKLLIQNISKQRQSQALQLQKQFQEKQKTVEIDKNQKIQCQNSQKNEISTKNTQKQVESIKKLQQKGFKMSNKQKNHQQFQLNNEHNSSYSIDQLYHSHFLKQIKQSSDFFSSFINIIEDIIKTQKLTFQQKQKLLNKIVQCYNQLSIVVKSFTQFQRQRMQKILLSGNLHNFSCLYQK